MVVECKMRSLYGSKQIAENAWLIKVELWKFLPSVVLKVRGSKIPSTRLHITQPLVQDHLETEVPKKVMTFLWALALEASKQETKGGENFLKCSFSLIGAACLMFNKIMATSFIYFLHALHDNSHFFLHESLGGFLKAWQKCCGWTLSKGTLMQLLLKDIIGCSRSLIEFLPVGAWLSLSSQLFRVQQTTFFLS